MSYERDGYEIIEIDPAPVIEARWLLMGMFGELEHYRGGNLQAHSLAAKVLSYLPRKVILSNLRYFHTLIGRDLHIQRQPFLRISRPDVVEDNIGMHRDTWYGDTPHEISVWIPLTDTDDDNALRVAPGSHLWSEAAHPVERFDGSVEKGSVKHSLGFIHGNPKRLATPAETIPLPVRVGQMIVFPLSLLHGVEVNRSNRTRFSMDVRLANSLAPIRWERSRDEGYYEQLCVSPATKVAKAYAEANR